MIILYLCQLTSFITVTEIDGQTNQQPDEKYHPVPEPDLCHQVETAQQTQYGNQRQLFKEGKYSERQCGYHEKEEGNIMLPHLPAACK